MYSKNDLLKGQHGTYVINTDGNSLDSFECEW